MENTQVNIWRLLNLDASSVKKVTPLSDSRDYSLRVSTTPWQEESAQVLFKNLDLNDFKMERVQSILKMSQFRVALCKSEPDERPAAQSTETSEEPISPFSLARELESESVKVDEEGKEGENSIT